MTLSLPVIPNKLVKNSITEGILINLQYLVEDTYSFGPCSGRTNVITLDLGLPVLLRGHSLFFKVRIVV